MKVKGHLQGDSGSEPNPALNTGSPLPSSTTFPTPGQMRSSFCLRHAGGSQAFANFWVVFPRVLLDGDELPLPHHCPDWTWLISINDTSQDPDDTLPPCTSCCSSLRTRGCAGLTGDVSLASDFLKETHAGPSFTQLLNAKQTSKATTSCTGCSHWK